MVAGKDTVHSARLKAAAAAFRDRGGILRMVEALEAGIHRRTLYELRDLGIVEQLSRGLYRLAEAPSLGSPDLVAVAHRVPRGVVCLVSALAFHELTEEIPHEVYLAVSRASEPPRIDYPPVRVFRFGPATYEAGVEIHRLDGVPVRIYGPEKTLADCFKYRNKVGLDTAVKALRAYRDRRKLDVGKIMRFAELCRVKNVMRPYVEAIL